MSGRQRELTCPVASRGILKAIWRCKSACFIHETSLLCGHPFLKLPPLVLATRHTTRPALNLDDAASHPLVGAGRARRLPRALVLSASLAISVALSACAGGEKAKREEKNPYTPPGQTGCLVEELRFEGVEVVDEGDLIDGLATQEDPGWRAKPFFQVIPVLGAEHEYYNGVRFERDLERILTFYELRGYYNAQIVSQSVTKCVEGGSVQITLTIDEGLPTGVASVTYEGLEQDPELLEEIKRGSPIQVGEIFIQEDYLLEKERVARLLRQESYAYGRVRGRAVVNPRTRQAEVMYFVDTGPPSVFAEATVVGLGRVEEEYVREAITFEPGQEYNAKALQQTQERLYDLGVFSLVSVQPDFQLDPERDGSPEGDQGDDVGLDTEELEIDVLDDNEARQQEEGEEILGALGISEVLDQAQRDAQERDTLSRSVPITIRLKEAKVWTGRVGAGFAFNSTRQDVHGAFNVTNRNFLNKLGKLEQFNTVGYALTPGVLQVIERRAENRDLRLDDFGNRGVFFDALLRYSQPQFIERLTTGFLQAKVTRDIQENYIGLIPSGNIGLRRRLFLRELQFEVSYNVLFILYQDFPDDFARELRLQGLDPNANNGRPSLLLEYLEQRIIYDGRDSPINPTRGVRSQVSMQEAGDYVVGGEYRYLKPQFDIDGYVPIGSSLVSAARFSLGAIYNTNPPAGDATLNIPLQSKLYGGGKGSVRSFGPRYFGFFTDDLIDPGPIGSNTLLELSVEQRLRIKKNLLDVGDLWGALFADAGSFTNRQLLFDTRANNEGTVGFDELTATLIYGAGAGIYWLTPVGPLRADLALTLTDLSQDPRFGPDPNAVDDPNTVPNEATLEQRYSEARLNKIRGFDFYIGIGHSF